MADPVAAPAKQVEPVAPQAPSDDEWHREADRLRKCVEYAPTAGEAYTFRVQLGTHLHKKPRRPSAPPPVVEVRMLTDEEISVIAERMEATDPTATFWKEFARAIEAEVNGLALPAGKGEE